MNLLLFQHHELVDGRLTLRDRRAEHIRKVLRASPGDALRVGMLGGGVGTAKVISVEVGCVALDVELSAESPALRPLTVVVAIPRPPMLRRVLHAVACFRAQRLLLIGARRVEGSFFSSHALRPDAIDAQLSHGCEQTGSTQLPQVEVIERFHRALDAMRATSEAKWVLDGSATSPLPSRLDPQPTAIAIGPEGGFLEDELCAFEDCGFQRATLGQPIWRTDFAVAVALGQLEHAGVVGD